MVSLKKQSANDTFLVYFPTNRDPNFLTTALLFFHAAFKDDEQLKRRFKIVIAASPDNSSYIEKIVRIFTEEKYDIECIVGTEYLQKLRAVFSHYPSKKYKYFIKHDDDVFIPPLVWRTLINESPGALANSKDTLLTTVNLSTGIPSWYYFAKVFFSKKFITTLETQLQSKKVPNQLWGNDYSSLNKLIANQKKWHEDEYWSAMNKLKYHHRGLHPLRLFIVFTAEINEKILKNFASFYNWKPSVSWNKVSNRYLCNNFFIINYDTYKKVINSKELFVDVFDEIPLNRYLLKYKKSIAFLKQSVAVHVGYNTTYDQYRTYAGKKLNGRKLEYTYVVEYFSHLKKTLAEQGDPLSSNITLYKEPLYKGVIHTLGELTRPLPFYPFLASAYEKLTRKKVL